MTTQRKYFQYQRKYFQQPTKLYSFLDLLGAKRHYEIFYFKVSLEKKQNNKTKRSLWCHLLHKMIAPLSANPDFDDKIEDVTLWFIEYDDVVNHIANREIGFAKDGRIIVKMPDDRNYGYWLDTNCELEDFKKMGINMITEKEFNDLWNSVYYDRVAKEFKQTVIKNGD